jgi:hypothetical protein
MVQVYSCAGAICQHLLLISGSRKPSHRHSFGQMRRKQADRAGFGAAELRIFGGNQRILQIKAKESHAK